MKKYLSIIVILLFALTSCDTHYNYATITVKNQSTERMAYKGLVRDEQSGEAPGDWIIKVKLPNVSILEKKSSDTINHTWKSGYDSIKFALVWGFMDASGDYNVYDCTTDYVDIFDGEHVIFQVDSTNDPTIIRKKL